MDIRKSIGDLGEELAAGILKQKGYEIVARKYRCKAGEIDIIAREKDNLVFVEVKTRMTADFGRPAESVTREKQRHIKRTAASFLQNHRHDEFNITFQVIEVMINQIENAF